MGLWNYERCNRANSSDLVNEVGEYMQGMKVINLMVNILENMNWSLVHFAVSAYEGMN